jgi:antitoxin YefM
MRFIEQTIPPQTLETLINLVDEAPVVLKQGEKSAVLVSDADWRSIEETLYLLSVPHMRESLREGMETPIADCSTTLNW